MKGRVLAVDYGSRRVGVALSDPLRVLARGVATLSNDAALEDSLLDIVRTEEVTLILVGMPYAPDGGMGKTAQEVRRFIDRLSERTAVPVTTWDESQSTRQAQQLLIEAGMKQARRRRREKLDELAARIMLQEFLDAQDPEAGTGAPESRPVPVQCPWWRAAFRWVRSHIVLTVLGVILLWVLLEAATIPWFAVGELRQENPGETALMRQREEEAAEEGRNLKIVREWVPLRQLPRHFLDAVIVAEDGTFYRHGGIEWFEVWESLRRNLEEGRVARGASSITQQLAKNLYLSTDQTPLRKLKELLITLLLEGELTKDRILELYVNVIEWGPGVFGVQAAARRYFDTPASRLSLEESIRLVAVIPSPLKHRPDRESRYLRFQTRVIRERMRARGMLPAPAKVAPAEVPPAPLLPVPADAEKDTTHAL